MSNTLTNLIPDVIVGLETVSREMVGLIPRVARSSTAERSAKGTTVRSPVAPKQTAGAITTAATAPAISDNTYTNRTISLSNLYATRWHYEGEEQAALRLTGVYSSLFAQNVAQAMRALVTEIETDLAELYYNACRAYGTQGTTPFASDLSPLSACKAMLDKNGAPGADRHLVMSNEAAYTMRNLTQLTNVNQSGTSKVLVEGSFMNIMGFDLAESAYIQTHTAGDSTGQDVNGGDTAGTTSITFHGASGNVLAGDIISIATGDDTGPGGSTNKYVVTTAVDTSGELVIGSPGLLNEWADTTEIALNTNDYVANLAFHRNFLALATRPPMKPEGGDAATDDVVVTDPVSGLSFLLSVYPGYHTNQYELSVLWGVGTGNPEQGVILMG